MALDGDQKPHIMSDLPLLGQRTASQENNIFMAKRQSTDQRDRGECLVSTHL